ncbi:MAG: serine/threonine-protein kinase [Chloroflexota bacterium]
MVSNEDCLTASAAQKLVNDPNYDIEAYIGKGAMACVYKATERGTPNVYAMKLLRERYRMDTQFIEFFEREAVSMRDLQYPNIVRFYTHSVQEDYAYILMDYVDGVPLTKIIGQARRNEAMIPLDMIMVTMAQIARAIGYLHRQKYVHRDIKPGNVLIRDNNEAYLTDLGIAGMVTSQDDDDFYLGAGTPSYMPYEQQTFEKIDHTADIYAFAVMMYEMFTAKKPFTTQPGLGIKEARKQIVELHRKGEFDSLLQIRPELPPSIDTHFERALATKPSERYQDVMDFAKDVHESLVKANLISDALHDFDVIKPQPIPQATTNGNAGASAELVQANKAKNILQDSRLPLIAMVGVLIVLSLLIMFMLSQQGAQENPVTVTSDATVQVASPTVVPATQAPPTEIVDARFFAEGALSPLAVNSIVEADEAEVTLLNLLVGSEGEANIALSDSVDAFELSLTLDAMPVDDAFSYGVLFGAMSVVVVGDSDTTELLFEDESLARYDELSQLPQTLIVRVREDTVQIETVSFTEETSAPDIAIYDVDVTVAPVADLSLTFTGLVPDVILDSVELSVAGEDIRIEPLPALSMMQSGARALRATGDASGLITCPAFVNVYEGIQALRTVDGVNDLLTDIEVYNFDVYRACEGEDSITAAMGWSDDMNDLIDDFSD